MVAPGREFLDTNVLVYAYEPGAGARDDAARELVGALTKARRGVLSVQVMLEFHNTMTREFASGPSYSPEVAVRRLRRFSRWPVHSPIAEDVTAAAVISEHAQISIWDAMIVRSAERMGCRVLWTEDLNQGQVVAGVEIRNPFAD